MGNTVSQQDRTPVSSEFDSKLLEDGCSAMLGTEVVFTDSAQPQKAEGGAVVSANSLPRFSFHDIFFNLTYMPIPLESVKASDLFEIYVQTLTCSRIIIKVTEYFSIGNIKASIEEKEDIPAKKQRLGFDNRTLSDDETVQSAGIPPKGTIYLTLKLQGGGVKIQISKKELFPEYDYDFTNERNDGKKYMRGSHEYYRPYGWYRYAIKVQGDPKYGDDRWLGPKGLRTYTSDEEWPVSYHGTSMENAKLIIKEGFKAGYRNVYGVGVYSSPSLTMVEKRYAKEFESRGKTYKIALQNRVNPARDHLAIVPANKTRVDAEYWISHKQNPKKGVYDIRPYGIVIRRVK